MSLNSLQYPNFYKLYLKMNDLLSSTQDYTEEWREFLGCSSLRSCRSRGSRDEDKDGSRVAEHDLQVTKALGFFSWAPCSSCSCSWSRSSLFLRCSCCSWWLLELVAVKGVVVVVDGME